MSILGFLTLIRQRYHPSSQPTLADYGIELVGWDGEEQTFLDGLQKITTAFSNHYTMPNTPETFKTIMYGAGRTTMRFIRSTDNAFECVTNNSVDSPLQTEWTCGGGVIMTEFTVVHELGHAFVNRTGGHISEASGAEQTTFFGMISYPEIRLNAEAPLGQEGTPLRDFTTPLSGVVFGPFPEDIPNIDNGIGWVRGSRGWGSFNRALPNPTDFQQNPTSQVVEGPGAVEVDEAAADMFLNWVYSVINQGGFANVVWTEPGCQVDLAQLPANCYQNTARPGDSRRQWMNNKMNQLRINLGF